MARRRHRLYLPGNGVRALGVLGPADDVLACAVCMSHQRVLDHAGRPLTEIALAKLWNAVGLCVGIAHGDLHRILLEGAGGVALRLGTTVMTLSQQHDEVSVVFADGSTGTYDLVVGARQPSRKQSEAGLATSSALTEGLSRFAFAILNA